MNTNIPQSLPDPSAAVTVPTPSAGRGTQAAHVPSPEPDTASAAVDPAVDAALTQLDGAPVDHEKVGRLRQALASGTYHIDPGRIADKIIEMEKALG